MTAIELYEAKRALIGQYLERISDELLVHVALQERDPKNWGYAADLVLIEARMAEILGTLNGLTADEIAKYRI